MTPGFLAAESLNRPARLNALTSELVRHGIRAAGDLPQKSRTARLSPVIAAVVDHDRRWPIAPES